MSVEKNLIKSKAFKDNFGQYMVWSGIYCGNNVYPGCVLIFYIVHTFFLLYTLILSISKDNEKLMGETAHFTAFRFSAILLLINGLWKKEDLEALFLKLCQPQVHDYGNTLSDQCRKDIEGARQNCKARKDFYGPNFMRTVTVALVIFWIRSLMEYFNGHLDNPKSDDGINSNLPVPTYLPYESHEWPGYHFALVCEVLLVMMSYFLVLGHDCSFICFAEEILRELDILIITLTEVERRIDHVRKSSNYKISQEESVRLCLKHSVMHHQKVIHIFEHFQHYCFHSLFFMLSGGAFLICLSSLMFTSDTISLRDKSVFLMFLGNELFHIFIFCYYGEHIMGKSDDVGNSLYNSSWVGISKHVKPTFMLLNLRCQVPLTLSAGGFMTASFDTYGNVLRTAYSYLNLLQATN
uniref:Odorant receptor n=1 Tax=Adelphocoris lineolatus TaxID=236346 RepID=A0A2I4PH92_ADELI|nr:olfactory receptor 80 [Adelphocoris lineolatus]